MDSITHIVLGAAAGEVMLGKRIGKKAMLIGAVTNNIPDLDVTAHYFFDQVTAALIHRGFTHSFLFAALISPLLGILCYNLFSKYLVEKRQWIKFFFVTIVLHDAVDVLTSYGTGLLEPFSHKRFAANSVFIADPFFTFPLFVAFIILLVLKKSHSKRCMINATAIFLSCAYLVFTFINKSHINNIAETSLKNQNIIYTRLLTTPAPLSNFLWYIVAKTDRGFYTGYYSNFDSTKEIEFHYTPSNDLMLVLFPQNNSVEMLKIFSMGYFTITKKDQQIFFNDLRFGRVAGWEFPGSQFVFSYNISRTPGTGEILRRTDFEISMKDAFKSLVKRIKGN